jgi:hypothetical protein
MFIGILFITNNGSAQNYQTGIGARFGGLTSGLTVKHFVSNTSALDGILGIGHKSLIVTGLYEKHVPVNNSRLCKLYYGAGGHLGFFQNGGSYFYNDHRQYTSSTVVGVDGIVGMEYTFKDSPVNIGLDFKPFIDFFNGSTVYFDGGISLRYSF